jgi:hypothetical protein
MVLCDEPTTYEDAINGKDSKEWTIAINEELQTHERNNTWTIVDLPGKEKNIIDHKWVFKRKPILCEGRKRRFDSKHDCVPRVSHKNQALTSRKYTHR